ncbi:MFS transporter [Actinomadura rupiterrae]|uniref:MFS transporter n=1 Tax=Actinomadura rupiterrae TaxID=559627 RepID=UPI0020A2CBB1|nr:MFS transporter [Actinomadura rupiterrae]MCP2340429.1 EmrB/QacA subfamily drug resistance transporter [Actinomadura rupiterrae]
MTAVTAPESAPARVSAPGWGTLLVLLTGIFITTLDFFIVNVAIPATQRDLHATPSQIEFVVAGFGVALAAGLITAGRLGDLYGRRRMFSIGLAVFTLASAACAEAPTAGTLIAGRVAQGVGAALLMPQVLGIVNTVYTGAARAKAFNAYGVAMGFGGVFGQLIGGVLIKADIAGMGWRAIFWINVPVGAAALALVPRLVPESRAPGAARLDLVGTVLASLGLVAIVYPLVQGREQGWPMWTWECLGAAVVLLAAFVLYQRRAAAPLVAPALFRHRAFAAGAVVSLLHAMTMGSFFLILALYLQMGRGLSALESGLIFLPLGLGYFVSSARAAAVTERLGRQTVAVGALAMALGLGVLAVTATELGQHGAIGWIIPGLVVAGAGMGLVMAPLPALALSRVDAEHAGAASGVLSTAQQAGGAIGVALVGVVFYGAHGGVPHAFATGLDLLIVLDVLVAALVQALPRTR